jgi:hypothetical protein
VLDTNAAQLRIKHLHDIGRVELGKESIMAKVSWMYGGKRYYGTLIPSRETKTHRFARTENGKIKRLPKKK